MTTRKMWARKTWPNALALEVTANKLDEFVPVFITDAEGMPDFEPGDRVVIDVDHKDPANVVAVPTCIEGEWLVPVRRERDSWLLAMWHHGRLTKLPREKTVTLRVTGPEDELERSLSRMDHIADPCRVERVEDDR